MLDWEPDWASGSGWHWLLDWEPDWASGSGWHWVRHHDLYWEPDSKPVSDYDYSPVSNAQSECETVPAW